MYFKERLKREAYQTELRQQIEEKRRLSALRDERERQEQELENRRFEQQLLRMQEDQLREEQCRSRKNQMVNIIICLLMQLRVNLLSNK